MRPSRGTDLAVAVNAVVPGRLSLDEAVPHDMEPAVVTERIRDRFVRTMERR